jgi:hypothetical protein
MTRFEQIQQILERAVNDLTIGRHGNFWRNKTRDQFIYARVFGRPLLVVGKSAESNLVRALRGTAPFDGTELPRMPVGFVPVADDQIQIIAQWIDDGCPDTSSEDAAAASKSTSAHGERR